MRASTLLRMCADRVVNHSLYVKNVYSVGSAASATTAVLTVPSGGVAAGHTVLIRVASDYTASAPTMSDNRSNTYTLVRSAPGTGSVGRACIFSCHVTTALVSGDSITVTWGSTITNRVVIADEFSGLLTPLTIDAQNGSTGNSTTPDANVTTTNAVDLVFASITALNQTFGYTDDTTWYDLPQIGTGGVPKTIVGGGYQITTHTNTWHYKPVLNASGVWIALCVAFKST